MSFKDLASSIGLNEGAITRILRNGIAYHIFREPRPGFVAHSAASRQLADDTRAAGWVSANVDEMWPSAVKLLEALEKWPEASEPNQTVCTRNRSRRYETKIVLGIFAKPRNRFVFLPSLVQRSGACSSFW